MPVERCKVTVQPLNVTMSAMPSPVKSPARENAEPPHGELMAQVWLVNDEIGRAHV